MSVNTDEDRDTGEKPDAEAAEISEAAASEAETETEASVKDGEKSSETQTGGDDNGGGGGGELAVGRGRRPVLRAVIIAAFVVLLAAVGFLGWQLWQERQVAAAAEHARQAAADYAKVLTSIDSAKVDENFDAVLDGATGEFKDMYSQSSTELRQLLIDNKATANGVVLESAVQSATKDKAVVLLFVDQSVSNANVPDPRIDRSRIKMTMEYVDGRWRASKVELP